MPLPPGEAAGPERFRDLPSRQCYLGYLDILGFSDLVRNDFDRAKDAYDTIIEDAALRGQVHPSSGPSSSPLEITAVSDSFVIAGDELQAVANWCSGLLVGAIREHLLARGSIAYGRHVQQNLHGQGSSRHHTLIVSEALVWAVEDEKRSSHTRGRWLWKPRTMGPPCGVTLHRSVPAQALQDLDGKPQLAKQRAIVFKDGRWVVNPYDGATLRWIKKDLQQMFDENCGGPHEPKYRWMLELYAAVERNEPLRPVRA